MGNTFYFDFEVRLMEYMQEHMGNILTSLAGFFSAFGEEAILIVFIAFFYWGIDKEYGKRIAVNIITAILACCIFKNIVVRRRPYFDNEEIKCLRKIDSSADIYDIKAQGYSFPSMHSANAASVYSSVALYAKKRIFTVAMILIIFLVGISRCALGVHYPTDVFFGWFTGIFSVLFMGYLQDRIKDTRLIYLGIFVISMSGWFVCESEDFYSAFGLMVGTFSGFMFEEKYVNFEGTENKLHIVLRIAFGLAFFVILSAAFKMPFSEEFLLSDSLSSHFVRAARYAVVLFIMIGIYPALFKKLKM